MKKKQGFASLTKQRRTQLAQKGGIKAHQMGVAHRWTPEEARAASHLASANRRKNVVS